MTIKEFFESDERIAIHCETEKGAERLLKEFDREGYRWVDRTPYTETTNWYVYKNDTCYGNDGTYGNRAFYRNVRRFKIIELTEVKRK